MSSTQAQLFHEEKMRITEDLSELANKATNPDMRAIRYANSCWKLKTNGGLTNMSMIDTISKYKEEHPDVLLDYEISEDFFCAVLVTPFMMRVNKMAKESGEVVFIDATSSVDQNNIAVVPLLCSSVAGALPLAVLFLSSQDQASFTKG